MYRRLGVLVALLIILVASVAPKSDPPGRDVTTGATVISDDTPNTNAFIKPHVDVSVVLERPLEDSAVTVADLHTPEADLDKLSASKSPLPGTDAGVRRAILRVYLI
ncbi:MAG: hypothetical protein WD275_08285 [Rhodothermales bacterium]